MSLVARPLGLALYFTRIHMEPEVSLLVVMMVFLTMVDVVVVEVFSSTLQHWWCCGGVVLVDGVDDVPRPGDAGDPGGHAPQDRSRRPAHPPSPQVSTIPHGTQAPVFPFPFWVL